MVHRVFNIIQKEFQIELRERYSFLSSLLYLLTITFVVFKIFDKLEGPTRIAIFWVLLLFASVNILGFGFSYQAQKRKLIYYQLYNPQDYILAKWLFGWIKMIIAGGLLWILIAILSNQSLLDPWLFIKSSILMITGIVTVLNLVSLISSYSQNQNTLVSILSLPLLIPILLLGMRICLVSERMFSDSGVGNYLLLLCAINVILFSLTYIFVPIVWKS